MKKTIMLSALVALMALVVVGCGGGDTKTVVEKKPIDKPAPISDTPQAHVGDIKRVVKHEFDLPKGQNIKNTKDNREGMVILEDSSNYYISINHQNAAKNVQFLIDTDNNSKTGNPSEGGAEILVENGQLYTYNEGNETVWKKYIENPTYSAYNAGEKKDTIKLDKNLILSPNFGVKAEVLNEDWQPIIISPNKYAKTYYGVDMSSYEDFKNMIVYISSTDNNFSVKIREYTEYVDMLLSSNTFTHFMNVYIDCDLDEGTGFKPTLDDNTLMWANMGADYFIENAKLYSYDSTLEWPWRFEYDLPYIITENAQKNISFHIKKEELKNLSTGIKIGIITNDRNWNNTQAVPDINASADIPTYTF
jgi:hypothetical protein